jgi:hypothetical protein
MTIAQQLEITEFPYEIRNKAGQQIYYETDYGYWEVMHYDEAGQTTCVSNLPGTEIHN